MGKIFSFFIETKEELVKVIWPSREQTIRYTALVIITAVTVGIFLGLIDFGLTKLTDLLLNR